MPDTHIRPQTVKDKERFSSSNKRWMLVLRGKWGLAIDKFLVWTTGYSLMTAQYMATAREPYRHTLYLQTVGAKTGVKRSACLPFFLVDGQYVLRGSNGGGATDPAWVHNIRADQCAWIRVNRKNIAVQAYVAQGQQYEELYQRLCDESRSTKAYQAMCSPRQLPLVVLNPW